MGGEEGEIMTHRADLLALTADDLTVLSNRGLVKRAQRELSAGQLTYEVKETADELQFTWSDGVVCRLPAGEVSSDRHCTCTATTLCRHLIRSVLAYQATAASSPSDNPLPKPAQTPLPDAPVWNPGDIQDSDLSPYFRPAQLKKLRQEFAAGQVIEVTCSRKPTAQLHNFPHTLRFLVPYDLRYTYCDCTHDSPCPHVPLAIWAFRQLSKQPPEQSGIISTETAPATTPTPLLENIERALADLVSTGLQGLSPGTMANLKQLEERCHRENLVWPANILEDLISHCHFYRSQDARFSPEQVTDLIAELCIRSDAIRAHTGAIPQLLIRGPHLKRLSELGATRLIGLGCSARVQRKSFALEAYFQDTDSGRVLTYASPLNPLSKDGAEVTSRFLDIASPPALRQTSWTHLGAGQLLIKRGACSPSYQLHLKRNQSTIVNPQRFEWEKLRAPILVDDFMALQQRLQSLPPKSLRPRRLAENFYVFAISQAEAVTFSSVEQSVVATLYDQYQNRAFLSFPYTQQAHDGTEALLNVLKQKVCFIAGHVSLRSHQMQITPTSLVFEQSEGRNMLQPWLYSPTSAEADLEVPAQLETVRRAIAPTHPIQHYLHSLSSALSAMLVNGLLAERSRPSAILNKLVDQGHELGFYQTAHQLASLRAQIDLDSVQIDQLTQEYLNSLVLLKMLQ